MLAGSADFPSHIANVLQGQSPWLYLEVNVLQDLQEDHSLGSLAETLVVLLVVGMIDHSVHQEGHSSDSKRKVLVALLGVVAVVDVHP